MAPCLEVDQFAMLARNSFVKDAMQNEIKQMIDEVYLTMHVLGLVPL